MSQKEIDIQMEAVINDSIAAVNAALSNLKCRPICGPVVPAMQRLEEAGFWLRACYDSQVIHNRETYGCRDFAGEDM